MSQPRRAADADPAAGKKNPTSPPPMWKATERPPLSKPTVIADLNAEPPDSDGGEDCVPVSVSAPSSSARNNNDENTLVRSAVIKDSDIMDAEDIDQQCQGSSISREEKVTTLKAGLVHVTRKMPKNAHAHFILGLMYQRLGQPHKAVSAFEKSTEILQKDDEDIQRSDLLSLVLIHHAQCILHANIGDNLDKELGSSDLEEILAKLKSSVQLDTKQAAVWNTLGWLLLRTGRIKNAIAVLSSLLDVAPDCLDSLANLGIAYLQSGNLELSTKCFQDLLLKDQHHPAALMNYAALLLCKHGTVIPGPGAQASEGTSIHQVEAAHVAKECLLAAVKSDPKSGPLWLNLASAYHMARDHRSAKKCLEKAASLEPNQMTTRYAVAVHRVKDAERSLDSREQLTWAVNEMASIIREGDPSMVDLPIAWSGLAMAHKAHHEITATYESGPIDFPEAEERAFHAMKQAIEEDPDDTVQWHQLGVHSLRTLQFASSVKIFKAAVARSRECCYAWSNLGIALQLSDEPASAELVYKRALSLCRNQEAHPILSNLGNLYRQLKRFEHAKAYLRKSLEICPGYAPALNNLGLVYVAEGLWEESKSYFQKALTSDPLLDAAMSNLLKVLAISPSDDRR